MITNRSEFIKWLEENDIPHSEYTENGLDQVYVFSKKEYEAKRAHPRKNKDLYVPYIRVSHFDEWPVLYVRDNGFTYNSDIETITIKCACDYM